MSLDPMGDKSKKDDSKIKQPPGTPAQDPDAPVEEPDDAPTTGPNAPVQEPEPPGPERLSFMKGFAKERSLSCVHIAPNLRTPIFGPL